MEPARGSTGGDLWRSPAACPAPEPRPACWSPWPPLCRSWPAPSAPRAPSGPADEPVDRAALLAPPTDFSAPEADEESPGGAATSRHAATRNAFSHFSATLTFAQQLDFKVGDGIFRKLWVSAPSSTTSSDGLGPLYNARSCQSCHLKDGRGHPAEGRWPDGDGTSMLFRVSVPPRHGRRARWRSRRAGRRSFRSRPTGRSSRASRSRGSRPKRGCGSRTRTVRSRSTVARSCTSSGRATGRRISGTGRCARMSALPPRRRRR